MHATSLRSFRRCLALGVSCAFAGTLLGLHSPPREIWIGAEPGTTLGDGRTPDTPLDGSSQARLDAIIEGLYASEGDYGPGVVIHFLAGEYQTSGIRVRPNWWILGAGRESTVLKRVPTEPERTVRAPYYAVIEGGWGPQRTLGLSGDPRPERDYANLRICDLTLDCNWAGLKATLGVMVKKAAGISLLCREVEVARVKVIHFGAQGGRPAWREVFPILILTSLRVTSEFPAYSDSVVDIHHCQVVGSVEGPDHTVEWPYCTGIAVANPHVDPQRHKVDVRVHHNEFLDLANGIGFGGAHLTGARFESNYVNRCYLGFNFDTGLNRDIVVRNNTFLACGGGGTVANGTGFVIQSNVIEILGNTVGKRAWANHGLRCFDYTGGFRVADNRIRLAAHAGTLAGDPHGILVYGTAVGVRRVETVPGHWSQEVARHVFEHNNIDPRLANRAGPQGPGQWLYVRIDGRDIDLSGHPDEGDGTVFEWRGSG